MPGRGLMWEVYGSASVESKGATVGRRKSNEAVNFGEIAEFWGGESERCWAGKNGCTRHV